MKNEDIHKGFPRTEIRDFLSDAHERTWTLDKISSLEKRIEELREQLAIAKKHQAAFQLIEGQGWKTWDISDEVPYNSSTYFPFVGTEEELDALLETIRLEEK